MSFFRLQNILNSAIQSGQGFYQAPGSSQDRIQEHTQTEDISSTDHDNGTVGDVIDGVEKVPSDLITQANQDQPQRESTHEKIQTAGTSSEEPDSCVDTGSFSQVDEGENILKTQTTTQDEIHTTNALSEKRAIYAGKESSATKHEAGNTHGDSAPPAEHEQLHDARHHIENLISRRHKLFITDDSTTPAEHAQIRQAKHWMDNGISRIDRLFQGRFERELSKRKSNMPTKQQIKTTIEVCWEGKENWCHRQPCRTFSYYDKPKKLQGQVDIETAELQRKAQLYFYTWNKLEIISEEAAYWMRLDRDDRHQRFIQAKKTLPPKQDTEATKLQEKAARKVL
ncbi:hypothetical protein BJ878DRAFT_480060 [Calycina marina]|uniref:Uncharacterized protein n=1 Tax=Calycina marina TaxID=1763456 RepID=A0A9P7Z2T8_9HELO|nr:hypothetical protein BJ878DRAFT_480060 [Calycina marina]